MRELLSQYFEVARTVIGRYGGVVEKFIGDAVMAVWGTPAATEGDAERAVRALLRGIAPGYRLNRADLPGKPDIVYIGRKLAIFVHGCFWHGHGCPMFRLPATRPEFWLAKIEANKMRDGQADKALAAAGWRRLTVWECALRGPARLPVAEALDLCDGFIRGGKAAQELQGRWDQLVERPRR